MLESKTKKEFSKVLFELEQLYCALREPTVDKLRRLGGLDPSPNCFFVQENPLPHAPLTSQADLLQPAQADRKGSGSIKSLKDSKYFKKAFIWNKLSSYVNHFAIRSDQQRREPMNTACHPKTWYLIELKNQHEFLRFLEALLIEKRITTGDLGTPQDMMSGASDGDELDSGKDLPTNKRLELGTRSKTSLSKCNLETRFPMPQKQSSCFNLWNLSIFWATTFFDTDYYPPLTSFYEAPESVVPELEFFETWSGCQALPYVRTSPAYRSSGTSCPRRPAYHTIPYPVDFHGGIPSEKFDEIRKTFLHDEFLERVHRLSSEIIKKPDADLREEKDNMTMVLFMGRLMRFFRNVRHVGEAITTVTTDAKYLSLQDELEFMRVYLATYRNSNDRTYPQTELQIMPFVSMFLDDRNNILNFVDGLKYSSPKSLITTIGMNRTSSTDTKDSTSGWTRFS
ncbi:hypothetical protein H4Q26_005449 [Puccinia striiformis f. sp. tritici PST-130]|nr:hypothetical protein H4Q26_005449 [Puccinia striiformis f. sp. tritici PST-130]